jgi:hypothetical protein
MESVKISGAGVTEIMRKPNKIFLVNQLVRARFLSEVDRQLFILDDITATF